MSALLSIQNINIMNIVYLVVVILLPMVPAYVLFKKLKSTAEAKGGLSEVKGLTFSLGGAFAAYFVVFAALYVKLPHTFEEKFTDQIWKITGEVKDAQTDKLVAGKNGELRISIDPYTILRDGKFTIYLPSSFQFKEEQLRYYLQIEDLDDKYHPSETIDLDQYTKACADSHIIKLPPNAFTMYRKSADTVSAIEMNALTRKY